MSNRNGEYENLSRHLLLDPTLQFYHISAKKLHDEADRLDMLRWHEEIEIKYMLSGQAEILCGPRVLIAQPGDVVIFNSCEMHGIRQHGSEPPVYHLLMLSPTLPFADRFSHMLTPVFERKAYFDTLVRSDETLNRWICMLFDSLTGKETAYSLESIGYLSLMLSHLLRHYTHSAVDRTDVQKYAEKLRPAIDYIYQHFREDIRVEDLARCCSLSQYYFCRMFHQGTGYTVTGFINNFRLSKAAALLRSSDLPVSAIASLVGYRDECYFSRCFRAWAGCAPSRYREENE